VEDVTVAPPDTATVSVVAAPCGQGASCRVVAAVRTQLHTTLVRRHALLSVAATQGSLSVWDLLHRSGLGSEATRSAGALLASLPTAHSLATQHATFSVKEVADDDFVLSGLFDVVYIDLRGRTTKADVLSAFSAQLVLRGTDASLQALQDSLQRFLRTLRNGSLLLLDHVHSSCATVVKSLLSSCLPLPTKKNKVSVVVIPSLQSASPILTAAAATAEATTGTTKPGGRSMQRLHGSASRRRQAWEKEQEVKSTAAFADELRATASGLGVRWRRRESTEEENDDVWADLPSTISLLTYTLSAEETRALAYRMHRELTTYERLQSKQPTAVQSALLGREVVDAMYTLSGGVPALVRLLLFQSPEALEQLLARRNDTASGTGMPPYMSAANTVRGSTAGAGLALGGSAGVSTSVGNNASNVYTVAWELQEPTIAALSAADRLLLYALSPLLNAHMALSASKTASHAAIANSPRGPPLAFDHQLAWHLSEALFVHHVTAQGAHNSVQTYAGKRGVPPSAADQLKEQAQRMWETSWAKLRSLGWLQDSDAYIYGNKVVRFANAVVPQGVGAGKSLGASLGADVITIFPEDLLMRKYVRYVSQVFADVSQTLSDIAQLLVTPEVGYQTSLLQQRNLLLLGTVDSVMQPHFTFLTSAVARCLQAQKTEKAPRARATTTPVSTARSHHSAEDDGADGAGPRMERGMLAARCCTVSYYTI
jgi:hypothetical protein